MASTQIMASGLFALVVSSCNRQTNSEFPVAGSFELIFASATIGCEPMPAMKVSIVHVDSPGAHTYLIEGAKPFDTASEPSSTSHRVTFGGIGEEDGDGEETQYDYELFAATAADNITGSLKRIERSGEEIERVCAYRVIGARK